MKAQNRFAIGMVSSLILMGTVACSHGSDSSGGSTSAESVIAASPSFITATVGQATPVSITGGSGTYTFSLSVVQGTLSQYSGTATGGLPVTVLVTASAQGSGSLVVTDTGGQTVNIPISASGGSGGTLTVSASSYTIAEGATDTISTTGGTGIYTYSVYSGGGTILPIGTSATYTAPLSNTTVTILVTDSSNNQGSTQITVGTGGTGSASSCAGNFTLYLDGYSSSGTTLEIGTNDPTTGAFFGILSVDGYGAPIQGSCLNGQISFTDSYSGSPYTGTYQTITTGLFFTGTYVDSQYGTLTWMAITP